MIRNIVQCNHCGEQRDLVDREIPFDWIEIRVIGFGHQHYCSTEHMELDAPALRKRMDEKPLSIKGAFNKFKQSLGGLSID